MDTQSGTTNSCSHFSKKRAILSEKKNNEGSTWYGEVCVVFIVHLLNLPMLNKFDKPYVWTLL